MEKPNRASPKVKWALTISNYTKHRNKSTILEINHKLRQPDIPSFYFSPVRNPYWASTCQERETLLLSPHHRYPSNSRQQIILFTEFSLYSQYKLAIQKINLLV